MDVIDSGVDFSSDPKFTEAIAHKVYYGPVYFRRESEPYMTLAISGTRRDGGVSVADVNLKLIWDVVSQIKVGKNGHAYVVDARWPPDRASRYQSRATQYRHGAARSGGAAARGEIQQGELQDAANIEGRSCPDRVRTCCAARVADVRRASRGRSLRAALRRAAAPRPGIVAALCFAAFAGMLLARRMVGPIQALGAGAARLGGGDLSQRIRIKTGDELEALADQFNDMAGRLQESYADLERKVELRTQELTASLEQQTATSEVLSVISRSPGDLGPVFKTMLSNALRICDAQFGNLLLFDGEKFLAAELHNAPAAYAKMYENGMSPGPHTGLGRLVSTKQVVHIADITAEQAYKSGDPLRLATVDLLKARSFLAVPMLKDKELVGAIVIYRQEVRPFDPKQIELVGNFASQAVIAIENVRLLNELRARTSDLVQSLDQQTATSEVLEIISSSPGELDPVFHAMLVNATRICEAQFGMMFLYRDGLFHPAAVLQLSAALAEYVQQRGSFRAPPGTPLDRLLQAKDVIYTADESKEAVSGVAARLRRSAVSRRRANVKRSGIGWRDRHLPSGGATLYRQADRVGRQFCEAGCRRNRERSSAE